MKIKIKYTCHTAKTIATQDYDNITYVNMMSNNLHIGIHTNHPTILERFITTLTLEGMSNGWKLFVNDDKHLVIKAKSDWDKEVDKKGQDVIDKLINK